MMVSKKSEDFEKIDFHKHQKFMNMKIFTKKKDQYEERSNTDDRITMNQSAETGEDQ